MDWGKRQIKSVGENTMWKDRIRIGRGVPPLLPTEVVEGVALDPYFLKGECVFKIFLYEAGGKLFKKCFVFCFFEKYFVFCFEKSVSGGSHI
jgi:hypothetical protein